MNAQVSSPFLNRAYVLALLVHAGLVALFVGLAPVQTGWLGTTANAAREGFGLSLMVLVTGLLAAVPSGFALMSWWLCRRRGWSPSVGHKVLTVVVAAAFLVAFAVSYLA